MVIPHDPMELAEAAEITPDPWQQTFLQSPSHRVLMNCHRQSGKSTIAAVLAVHGALYEPRTLTLLLSPSLRQSGEIFQTCKEIYAAIGKPVVAESETVLTLRLKNGSRIVSLPAKVGTIRGFKKVRRLIVDEAAWVPDEVYRSMRPVLAVSGGDLIAMSTPFGKRGWWYEAWSSTVEWDRYEIPATMCPRITPEFLAEERVSMPGPWFDQEYMCQFTDSGAQIFPTDLVLAAFDYDLQPLFPELMKAAEVAPILTEMPPLFGSTP